MRSVSRGQPRKRFHLMHPSYMEQVHQITCRRRSYFFVPLRFSSSFFSFPLPLSLLGSVQREFCSRRVQIEYSHVAIIVRWIRGIPNRFIDFTAVYFARVFCMFDWIAPRVLNGVEIKCLKFIRRNNRFSSSIKSSFPLNFFNFS